MLAVFLLFKSAVVVLETEFSGYGTFLHVYLLTTLYL